MPTRRCTNPSFMIQHFKVPILYPGSFLPLRMPPFLMPRYHIGRNNPTQEMHETCIPTQAYRLRQLSGRNLKYALKRLVIRQPISNLPSHQGCSPHATSCTEPTFSGSAQHRLNFPFDPQLPSRQASVPARSFARSIMHHAQTCIQLHLFASVSIFSWTSPPKVALKRHMLHRTSHFCIAFLYCTFMHKAELSQQPAGSHPFLPLMARDLKGRIGVPSTANLTQPCIHPFLTPYITPFITPFISDGQRSSISRIRI